MLYHAAPLEGATIALEMGHAVVIADQWDAETALADHRRAFRHQRIHGSDDVRAAAEAARRGSRPLFPASLRFVIHGGAPCPADVKRRMIDWWGPIVWESYGASEVQGVVTSSAEWLRHPGTVGKPIAGSQLKILDDDGRELPPEPWASST